MKNAGDIVLIVGIIGIAVYLIYSLKKKNQTPSDPISILSDAVVSAANGITGIIGDYEFNADTGDPNDSSNVFIPTM